MRLFASCARKMASQSARASRNGQQTLKSPTRVASKVAKRAADPEVVGWFMDRKALFQRAFYYRPFHEKAPSALSTVRCLLVKYRMKGTLLRCTCLYLSEKSKGPNENRAGRSPY